MPAGTAFLISRIHSNPRLHQAGVAQFVKKLACGDFFDDFCTVCLGAYGSPGGNR